MLALDTETTGVDLHHGAKPFFVTACQEDGTNLWWEWDVDPLTREPQIPLDDLFAIEKLIEAEQQSIIFQNGKFDIAGLGQITELATRIAHPLKWPWERTHDTLIAGHLLASGYGHRLDQMMVQYFRRSINHYEDRMEKAVQECRRFCRSRLPRWRIAKEGLPEMPSASSSGEKKEDKPWKFDCWLPRAIAKYRKFPADHWYWTVTAEYANADSAAAMLLWKFMEKELHRRGLWEIYETRRKVIRIAHRMEANGVTVSQERMTELSERYSKVSEEKAALCVNIASRYNYNLKLPKGAMNGSLRNFAFNELKLPIIKMGKQHPSFDKYVLEEYEDTLPRNSRASIFIKSLREWRKSGTAVNYMSGYTRYWVPLGIFNAKGEQLWYRLHPSLNPTGTATLRWSSSNPNEQNISKQEGFNLRYCFGPAPGREWWSLDAQNIELRIPSFEAEEPELMDVYNRPKDPPYYGSYHLVVFDALYPELFAKHGKECKTLFESTLYQWVKNGNFAIIYGAQEKKADQTYHFKGAYQKVRHRFPKIAKLSDYWKDFAQKRGYVETIPDRTVNPKHGYPLMVMRGERGQVEPTKPFNYHVSGSAMWWMGKAMIRVQDYMDELNEGQGLEEADEYFMALQVHDELVLDFPKGPSTKPWLYNLPKVRKVARLMEMGGDDIGIPTPVAIEYHERSWDEGLKL